MGSFFKRAAKRFLNKLRSIKQRIRLRFASLRYYSILLCQARFCKCVFVFGSPSHSNLGDNAQTLCIKELVRQEYPKHRIWFFTDGLIQQTNFRIISVIRRWCRKDAVIILHSGYHLTDIYMLVEFINRRIVEEFHDFPILAMPQTIFYKSPDEQEKSVRIYNAHPDLTIMCRDSVSYATAQKLFPRCKLLLMPDVVTMKIGCYQYSEPRKGILLCKRNDQESNLTKSQLDELIEQLSEIDSVSIADTTVSDSWHTINKDLKGYLEGVWSEYAHYRAIVTDRYHGTIFALIANTPVIVIPSTDHKLSSGVNWFPDSFSEYIRFAPTLDAAVSEVRRVYATKYDYALPPYFLDSFYRGVFKRVGFRK